MTSGFWKDKKVLITGHTGFKGSWLSLWLQSRGARVTGYALPPATQPSLFEDAGVARDMISIIGDVRDSDTLHAVMEKHKPEIIFHLAAQPLVKYSYDNPIETYSTNVMGTVNLMEAARKSDSVCVLVMITSDKCYENKEWFWGYRENDMMGGHDPYSSSKGCAELIISSYRRSFFSKKALDRHESALASVRAGNVIGGGDWSADRLIPDIMKSFIKGDPVIIRNPEATRPWQHVLEPLSGYICLAEKMWDNPSLFSQAWNFGPREGDARPVSWIVDYLVTLWGEGARWELDSAAHPHESTYLKLDCSKAKGLLGWAPKMGLARALEWTVEYYLAHKNSEDIRSVVLNQIKTYEGM